jgi:predicted solute-binding protein
VELDPASRTSNALVRILLERARGIRATYAFPPAEAADGRVEIGDRALNPPPAGFEAWDLGQAWSDWTGLPMVYAAWALRPGVAPTAAQERAFIDAAESGIARAGEIAEVEAERLGIPVDRCREYLTRVMRYRLDEDARRGWARFADECRRL